MPHKGEWRKFIPSLAIILVIIIGLITVYFVRKTVSSHPAVNVRFLLADNSTDKLTITNTSDKQLYQLKYPLSGYPSFVAAAPDGQLLAGISPGSTQEGFTLGRDNKAAKLSDSVLTSLRSSAIIGSSNQIYFTDNQTVVYLACSDTCNLTSLNIVTGQTKTVADTGVKSAQPATVYLLGLSSDRKSAFIRTMAPNQLGNDASAVYQVDLGSGKVQKETKTPVAAGYDLSLSPDGKSYIYSTGGYNTNIVLHVVDMATGKDTTTKWVKDELGGNPTTFSWSPDSKKVVFATVHITLPTDYKGGQPRNTVVAYLDTAKKTVTTLQTVVDQSKTMISYTGWLDNGTVVYNQQNTSTANDFSNPSNQAFKQNITSKQPSRLGSGQLLSVFRY